MLAFRGMPAGRPLRGAILTAFIASFLAMNCGREEFDLLPLEQENARGGSTTGGEANNGGFGLVSPPPETGGATTGGRASSGGRGSMGGAASGGRGGAPSGFPCVAPECCTKQEDCGGSLPYCLLDNECHECYLADDRSSVGCAENWVCGLGYFCYPGCVTGPCPGNLKCLSPTSPCVECLTHDDCDNHERGNFCVRNYCVACRSNADCPSFRTCSQINTCV